MVFFFLVIFIDISESESEFLCKEYLIKVGLKFVMFFLVRGRYIVCSNSGI